MSETTWKESQIDEDMLSTLAAQMKQSKTFIRLCLHRGLNSKEAIEHFVSPTREWFHNPFDMTGMEKTVHRIQEAVEKRQQITVYGDYDADGITSTVIMYEAIELLGGTVDYYIPNRFTDGYGPNVDAFERLIAKGTELIITVDNGIAGHEAIDYANKAGVDVIVTDHHECPETLPNAYSIVHPNHPDGHYPFKQLAGAGVSLKVAEALLQEIPEELLELAMIGTIADLVPLEDENRAIAYFGLQLIARTQRLGLLAFLQQAGIRPEDMDEEGVGFKLAPPFNAAGRLGEASIVVDLLTTFDEERAQELSQSVLASNNERKEIVEKITAEALEKVEECKLDPVIILSHENWHQGVLGIVASKIAEKVNKPTLIFSVDSQKGVLKGSGRSIEGFNLYACIDGARPLLSSFGGHEMACGISLPIENKEAFSDTVRTAAQKMLAGSDMSRELVIDSELDWSDLSVELIEELDQLKPFGQNNAKPLFKLSAANVRESRVIGANQDHFKAQLEKNERVLDLIAFHSADWHDVFRSKPTVDIAGYVNINEWNGNRKVQVQAIDFKTDRPVVIDKRQLKISPTVFKQHNAHYLFFSRRNFSNWQSAIHPEASSQLLEADLEPMDIPSSEAVVVVDVPDHLALMQKVYRHYDQHVIHCYLQSTNEYYFKGMPKRAQFMQLYKWLLSKEKINLAQETQTITRMLRVDKEMAKFMLMVFLENEFVTIENGELSVISNPNKKRLEDTVTYKKRQDQIEAEEKLVYSSFSELLTALKTH
ncbi:Single-stranded-DNA-specific exonuclease RecJ [Alkalibacterium sp. AK22]|uniref:single-stranded-DNA-specific exonuclease RecJ n=1 Tax=Alkalibacterium sp. AK22 TaxID=1229520 RepID=UPI00044D1839|nr:single-stranded-DNA-specific exonuclease RecJ [Alkalibacterium sp. AK22]EXJ24153.1 Single-stranded-DNA-specific exonuclease RecJ [Alkalibacterium sp. AK22]